MSEGTSLRSDTLSSGAPTNSATKVPKLVQSLPNEATFSLASVVSRPESGRSAAAKRTVAQAFQAIRSMLH